LIHAEHLFSEPALEAGRHFMPITCAPSIALIMSSSANSRLQRDGSFPNAFMERALVSATQLASTRDDHGRPGG
jgi:hypothetical protein